MNPYDPPEESDSRSAETGDEDFSLLERAVITAIGLAIEVGFIALVAVLYLLGGYWTLLAVFVGIPIACLGAMFFLLRGWKEKRHAYLREKRRQIKPRRKNGG